MAFWTNIADVHKNRPLKPRYTRTQATPQAVMLSPEEELAVWPGCVVYTDSKGEARVCTGDQKAAGLCGTWTREMELTGAEDIAMWVLGNDAIMALTAYNGDEFDTEVEWADELAKLDDGEAVYLKANDKGQLTAGGTADDAACRLVGMEGNQTLLIAGL